MIHRSLFARSFSLVAAMAMAPTLLAQSVPQKSDAKPAVVVTSQPDNPRYLSDEASTTRGSVTVGGKKVDYQAEAGILVVHLKDPRDTDPPLSKDDREGPLPPQAPEAGMSYVAYFKTDEPDARRRPLTFIFNGGPGSATVWLHMGAFGPKRVLTAADSHSPAAPYQIVNNDFSLLDVSDLVFIDAPGTGFGQLRGADKEKAFFGVDPDARAFANFIIEFLSRHQRWNSPKYVFGESYGTTRAAALTYVLQDESVDLNGVILLSQILAFDNSADEPQWNPSVDQPYALILPTYAATAWYHHKLPNQPEQLEPLLREVEQFALAEYLPALAAGSTLPAEKRAAIVAKLHQYTGLPADYIERANLRVNGGSFDKSVLGSDVTAGRLDSRFSGPTLDPLSKEAQYDPQSASISSAYVAAFNDYVRGTLKFGDRKTYKPSLPIWQTWDFTHQPPGYSMKWAGATNVIPDLAQAMKQNPNLKVQLHGGYYDLATPYFAAVYELSQLPIQPALQKNIESHFYKSGHMVYAREEDLKALHENTASFIDRTRKGNGGG